MNCPSKPYTKIFHTVENFSVLLLAYLMYCIQLDVAIKLHSFTLDN